MEEKDLSSGTGSADALTQLWRCGGCGAVEVWSTGQAGGAALVSSEMRSPPAYRPPSRCTRKGGQAQEMQLGVGGGAPGSPNVCVCVRKEDWLFKMEKNYTESLRPSSHL